VTSKSFQIRIIRLGDGFRLALETIDHRANAVRLIGLVLELEFHGNKKR